MSDVSETTPDRDDQTGPEVVGETSPGVADTTIGGEDDLAQLEFEGRLPDADTVAAAGPEEAYPDEVLQPETQGEDPVAAELGEEGQGDLAPEDL
ncbi:hypothetical protein QSU92_04850 [Microbacterium sp. ET2]|uniref:hypothetical protein n=1 Tax=Microbacterium albipurpureum TaxID=3050384 RepID=UPI00259C7BEF|nr:hypothetical protein [Microbacterium sp. ET2 (Ac-2212)]WJL96514.1 hypothetical protein QSU92_04850 [Microbacterium sp. ET2 (Ac-2212)]